jgi:hypothetical protein
MKIYHGGFCPVEKPEIRASANAKDFGRGFYCTQLQSQAERWAKRCSKKFWVLAKFKRPTHQIAFCTPRALARLRHLESYGVKP